VRTFIIRRSSSMSPRLLSLLADTSRHTRSHVHGHAHNTSRHTRSHVHGYVPPKHIFPRMNAQAGERCMRTWVRAGAQHSQRSGAPAVTSMVKGSATNIIEPMKGRPTLHLRVCVCVRACVWCATHDPCLAQKKRPTRVCLTGICVSRTTHTHTLKQRRWSMPVCRPQSAPASTYHHASTMCCALDVRRSGNACS
jgi:hypothetical protein